MPTHDQHHHAHQKHPAEVTSGRAPKPGENRGWFSPAAISADSRLQSSSPKCFKALPLVMNFDRRCLLSVHPKLKRNICQCKNSTVCTRGNTMLTQRSCNSSQELCADPLRLPSESHRQESSSSARWQARRSVSHDQARGAQEPAGAARCASNPTGDR